MGYSLQTPTARGKRRDFLKSSIGNKGEIIGTATYANTPSNPNNSAITPGQHGVLLVPCQFSLLNGAQSGVDGLDFDGSRPTKISQTSPDNLLVDNMLYYNGDLNILGVDIPFGSGTNESNETAYVYSIIMAAKVAPSSNTNITYSWHRTYVDRGVAIIKSGGWLGLFPHWEVKCVNNSDYPTGSPTSPVPDGPISSYATSAPSPNNVLYCHDRPGMNLDSFNSCTIGDFAYEETGFTYTLSISIGSAKATQTITVGQVIQAQRSAATGTSATDWNTKGNYNNISTSNMPDCQMPNDAAHMAIIRSIVGGALPIEITPQANQNY